jgi:hypothetical protein
VAGSRAVESGGGLSGSGWRPEREQAATGAEAGGVGAGAGDGRERPNGAAAGAARWRGGWSGRRPELPDEEEAGAGAGGAVCWCCHGGDWGEGEVRDDMWGPRA